MRWMDRPSRKAAVFLWKEEQDFSSFPPDPACQLEWQLAMSLPSELASLPHEVMSKVG